MKKAILSLAFVVLYTAVHARGASPEPFTATYNLRIGSLNVGTLERRLMSEDNGRYIYRSETKATGLLALFRDERILEQSVWKLEGEQIRPLEYTYRHKGSKKNRDATIHFDWKNGKIESHKGENQWKMAIERHVLDKLLYQWVAMRDLERDKGLKQVEYKVADGGKIKTYRFTPIGKETLTTPMGRFEALKFQRLRDADDKRETTLWCAPALRYLPIRVDNKEKDGTVITAEIETLSGLTGK